MSYDGQIPGISVCVSAACPGGLRAGDPDIYIPALPPLSRGISPGIFIHCTCWLPASRCRLEDATLGQGQSSKFPTFPPPHSLCFPKSQGRWEKGSLGKLRDPSRASVLAPEGSRSFLRKSLAGVWDEGTGVAFGMLPGPAQPHAPGPPVGHSSGGTVPVPPRLSRPVRRGMLRICQVGSHHLERVVSSSFPPGRAEDGSPKSTRPLWGAEALWEPGISAIST